MSNTQAKQDRVEIPETKALFKDFLRLPDNLRERIYLHVLESDNQLGRVLTVHGTTEDLATKRSPFWMPDEFSLAGHVYIYYAQVNICCEWCGKATLEFLDRIPPEGGELGRHAVKMINYDFYARNQNTNDFSFDTRFLQACPEVKTLTITMSVWDIIERLGQGPTGGYRPLTKPEILAKKDLMSIAKCNQLTRVWFRIIRAGGLHGDDVMNGMREICQDMVRIFHDQGNDEVYIRLNHRHLHEP